MHVRFAACSKTTGGWIFLYPCLRWVGLNVFCRQLRILWFTYRREHCKCKAGCTSSDGISRDERTRRERDPTCHEYWDKKLGKEESVGTFLSAISTLIEDAPEIMVYIMGRVGVQHNIGEFNRFTGLTVFWWRRNAITHLTFAIMRWFPQLHVLFIFRRFRSLWPISCDSKTTHTTHTLFKNTQQTCMNKMQMIITKEKKITTYT